VASPRPRQEDFVGSEACVTKLQTIAERGFTVQVRHMAEVPPRSPFTRGWLSSVSSLRLNHTSKD
jgi:hypothetical protein